MIQKEDIPCAACKQWNAEAKSFSCNPNKCSKLSDWLLEKIPQFNKNAEQTCEQIPETSIQYVV